MRQWCVPDFQSSKSFMSGICERLPPPNVRVKLACVADLIE